MVKIVPNWVVSEEMLVGTKIPGGGGRGRLYLTLHCHVTIRMILHSDVQQWKPVYCFINFGGSKSQKQHQWKPFYCFINFRGSKSQRQHPETTTSKVHGDLKLHHTKVLLLTSLRPYCSVKPAHISSLEGAWCELLWTGTIQSSGKVCK